MQLSSEIFRINASRDIAGGAKVLKWHSVAITPSFPPPTKHVFSGAPEELEDRSIYRKAHCRKQHRAPAANAVKACQ